MAAYTTIDNPELYFQTVLYTGNGAANHAITLPGDEDMQPDFVWIKNRDATDSHCLFDAVRGATEVLHADTTAVEATDADTLDSFTSDGFQVDADVKVNTNTEKYVAWCWKGGTTSVPSGSSVTSVTCSFSATAGFGVYKYINLAPGGKVLAHGLGTIPHFVMVKRSNMTTSWALYHSFINPSDNTQAGDFYLKLDTNAARIDNSGFFSDTLTDATNITFAVDNPVGGASSILVAHVFAPVQGYSAMGSYVGNGNADGAFVYTGFRPAFIIAKKTSGTGNWFMWDNKRDGSNPETEYLMPNEANAESTTNNNDLLSNGFKFRSSDADLNASGGDYIYMAFAEAPFVNSNGVPCNAR